MDASDALGNRSVARNSASASPLPPTTAKQLVSHPQEGPQQGRRRVSRRKAVPTHFPTSDAIAAKREASAAALGRRADRSVARTAPATEAQAVPPDDVLIIEQRSVLLEPQGLTARLDRYAKLTTQSREYFAWVLARDERRGNAGFGCAAHLIFRQFHTAEDKPTKLAGGYFCGQRHHCQFCAAGSAVRALGVGVPKVLARLSEDETLRPAMLTITCKDRDDLESMIAELFGSWSKWIERRRNQAKGRRGHTALTLLDGGILSAETKRGEGSGKWHFHAHAVVLAPPGLTKFQFFPEWSELLGYSANLDFRYLKSAKLLDDGHTVRAIQQQLATELLEVFKYALKTTDMQFADRYEAANILHRKHLMRSFGSMVGLELPEEITEDLTEFDGLPFVETVYRYLDKTYKEFTNYGDNCEELDGRTSDIYADRESGESRLSAPSDRTFGMSEAAVARLHESWLQQYVGARNSSPVDAA